LVRVRGGGKRRNRLRAPDQPAKSSGRGADKDRAAARAKNASGFVYRERSLVDRHRAKEALRIVYDGEIEGGILERQSRRRRDFHFNENARILRTSPARTADDSSGAIATARPDSPTLAATEANRPPCAQPTNATRSPSFTPVMLTRST